MVFMLLCFALLAALWWALLWLVLPISWLQGEFPSFIAVHVVPPFLPITAWVAGKRTWAWRKVKIKDRAEKIEAAEKAAAQEAAKAEHHKTQEQLRTFVECRAVWAAFASIPKWTEAGAKQCVIVEQPPEFLQGIGREAALTPSLQSVFSVAFEKCKAAVWLPVYFASDDTAQQGWIERAWEQAVEEGNIESYPPQPDCALLPGSGEIQDRLIALFENCPDLPAAILVGMDSPLADAVQQAPGSRLGHAVAALLLSRPGLSAPSEAQIAAASHWHEADDPMMPFWERERAHSAEASPAWGNMPLALQPEFLKNFPPIATLHRAAILHNPAPRQNALTQQFHETAQGALIRAGLRELPFEGEKQKIEQAKPKEPEFLDLGWVVHNADPNSLGALTPALNSLGCELDPITEASNVVTEHGDAGEAREMLMLLESLIRVAQLQKPILIAGFDNNKGISIGLACPAYPKPTAADTEKPAPQLEEAA